MIKNYLVLAVRNLLKRKVYSIINMLGLALGAAVCLVILKYVDFELSYDSFHSKASRIFRITTTSYRNGEDRGTDVLSSYALGPSLKSDVPEVEAFIRTHPMYGGAVVAYHRDEGEPSIFHEDNMQFVDSSFFHVFDYQAVAGNLPTALDNPASVVITKKTADKYFGKRENPLGKILQVSGGWADGDYEVTAVIENIPANAHFTFDFLFPTHNLLQNGQYRQDNGWDWFNFITYVELYSNTNAANVEKKLPAIIEKYRGEDLKRSNGKDVLNLQPIRSIHLNPGLGHDGAPTVSTSSVYFFVIISIFILAIAWVNYINLSTARAMERAREVGIKKAVGALRSQLMFQFIFESVLVNFLSVALAVSIATGLLPVLGAIVGKDLVFDFGDPRIWMILGGLFVIGSLVSGAYPAFVLSSFRATEVMKGVSQSIAGGFSLRKALVVFQFASSLVLIAGTFAIYRQIMYMRTEDKGLTMDQMLIVNGPSVFPQDENLSGPVARRMIRQRLVTLKNELRKLPGVVNVATSGAIPGGGYNWGTGMRKDGAPVEANKTGSVVWVDPDFVDTYGITVVSGRPFNPDIASDMNAILVNEASLTAFGLGSPENAVHERIILGSDTTRILGVLKNYHWNSLKIDHTPFLLKTDTIMGRCYSIHLSGDMKNTIEKIGERYKEAFPGNPFDYYFLDDFFNNQYKDDQRFGEIFSLFAGLAIVIACLGLWGLASFTTSQRLKEIGIRKVLGASVAGIITLLSGQFFRLVLIASVVALPLAWYGIHEWLATFAFRIGIRWDMFVVPVIVLAVLALGTVSLQVLRGANINPAKILRTE